MKNIFFSLLVFNSFSLLAQNKMVDFTNLEIDGTVKVELIQSDQYNIEVLDGKDLVHWEINGPSLVVIAQYEEGFDAPTIRIHAKEIKKIHLISGVILTANGRFETRNMRIQIDKQSIATLNVDTETLNVNINKQSILKLAGVADDCTIVADKQSILRASELKCAKITIQADHQSVLNLNKEGATISSDLKGQSVLNTHE